MNARILVSGLCLAGCSPGASPTGAGTDSARSVVIAPSVSDLVIGNMVQLSALVLDSVNDTLPKALVEWSSDHPAVATISSSGELQAVAVGTAAITARNASASSIRTFNVLAARPDSIVIDTSSPTIPVGQTVRFDATVTAIGDRPLPNASIEWSSDKGAVAMVDQSGDVHAVSPGEANITATSGGARDTRTVIVIRPGPALNRRSNHLP